MANLFHHFQINAAPEKVFENISTAKGLDRWWSKTSTGTPLLGEVYQLFFGEGYNWEAIVSTFIPGKAFELTMSKAAADWMNSKIGFHLTGQNNITEVHFYHTGWQEANEHYKISNYCWAMYLRILKRYLEHGEEVLYEERLNV